MNNKFIRYSLIIVEITSFPLFLLTLIYIITGYQMLTPLVIFSRPRILHLDRLLRILFVYLFLLHSYAGLIILTARRVRNRKISDLVMTAITAITALFLALFTLLELLI
ncbi:MAG: hypothetical protein QXS24_01865 [Desulfurococcaceae archaeon]